MFSLSKDELFDKQWLDDHTFIGYIPLSDNLRVIFKDLITGAETVDLQFEYWIDNDSFHYNLLFEDDYINVNNRIESMFLNSMVRECFEERVASR